MILNFSRSKTFRLCKRKAFNSYHRGLEGQRSMNLVDGGAFHHGVAVGRATKDWKAAKAAAKELFKMDTAKSNIPPEQLYLLEEHWKMVDKMLSCFEEQYEHEVYQIIQPEVEFDVPLPNSEHNCIFLHWMDEKGHTHWGQPPADKILRHKVYSPHSETGYGDFTSGIYKPKTECACYQPHRIVGKTDAVVAWNSNIWLDEYKTTSISGQQFWDQWQMDVQPTLYIWGIWKALGIRPRGFLLNAINKPSEGQLASYNNRRKSGPPKEMTDYIGYSREAFLRTKQDLLRVEQLMRDTCNEWEEEVMSGSERMANKTPFQINPGSHSCMSYNRKCDYWSACLAHDEAGELEALGKRSEDYVDIKLSALVGAK